MIKEHLHPGQKLIVVVGMHRSGTSSITRGLEVIGVTLGNRLLPPIAGNNDKGFYEDMDLVVLNEDILKACGKDWFSIEPIRAIDVNYLCDRGYLLRAIELLRNKMGSSKWFGFKDPRTAKLLPFWARVFSTGEFDVRFILALRNPLSTARSLEKRDSFYTEQAYLLWNDHTLASLSFLHDQPVIVTDYDQLLQDPQSELQRVAAWLDTSIDQDALTEYQQEFLDEGLRHSAFRPEDVFADPAASTLTKEIYRFLIEVRDGKATIEQAKSSGKLREWERELDRQNPALRLLDKQHLRIIQATSHINNLNHTANERDGQIANLNQAVNERDQQITNLNQAVNERDQQIARSIQIVSELECQIRIHERTIAEIYASISWRIIQKLHRIKYSFGLPTRKSRKREKT